MRIPPIVYFGNDWFADNQTSSHHVARQLARHTRVLYLEAPGLRPPKASARDIRRIGIKLRRAFGPGHQPAENLIVRTVPQLPFHGYSLVRAVNSAASSAYASVASRRAGMVDPIVWCTVPHVAKVAQRLRRSMLVYHCIDDYATLPGVNRSAVRALDEELTRAADLVIAASRPVFEAKRRLNASTLLMPHGVDVDHFARAQTADLPIPQELRAARRPIIGFIGLIESWIDLDLIKYLADNIPHATFVMVGRVAVPQEQVPQANNLLFLGPRPYERLPEYGGFFDVAVIPYKLTEQVIAANPLKLREYLAMGLPVVSVSTPEIDQFGEVVAIARTREAFLNAVRTALASPRSAAESRRRMQYVAATSWDARVVGLLRHIDEALANVRQRRVA